MASTWLRVFEIFLWRSKSPIIFSFVIFSPCAIEDSVGIHSGFCCRGLLPNIWSGLLGVLNLIRFLPFLSCSSAHSAEPSANSRRSRVSWRPPRRNRKEVNERSCLHSLIGASYLPSTLFLHRIISAWVVECEWAALTIKLEHCCFHAVDMLAIVLSTSTIAFGYLSYILSYRGFSNAIKIDYDALLVKKRNSADVLKKKKKSWCSSFGQDFPKIYCSRRNKLRSFHGLLSKCLPLIFRYDQISMTHALLGSSHVFM